MSPSPDYNLLGVHVREHRRANDLTQREAAALLSEMSGEVWSQSRFARLEEGRYEMTLDDLGPVARFLKIEESTVVLLARSGNAVETVLALEEATATD